MLRINLYIALLAAFASNCGSAQDSPTSFVVDGKGALNKWLAQISEKSCLEFLGGGMIPDDKKHGGASAIAANSDGSVVEVFTDRGKSYQIKQTGNGFTYGKVNENPYLEDLSKLEGVARVGKHMFFSFDTADEKVQNGSTWTGKAALFLKNGNSKKKKVIDLRNFEFKNSNSGFEAAAKLNGGVIILEEKKNDPNNNFSRGMFFNLTTESEISDANPVPFQYPLTDLEVSGATAIGNDLYVLERLYLGKNTKDVSFRIVRYKDLDPPSMGFAEKSKEVFDQKREILIEHKGASFSEKERGVATGINFEGISAFEDKHKNIYLYLISDNNLRPGRKDKDKLITDNIGTVFAHFKVKERCPDPSLIKDKETRKSIAAHLLDIAKGPSDYYDLDTQVLALKKLKGLVDLDLSQSENKSLACELNRLLENSRSRPMRYKYHVSEALISITKRQKDKTARLKLVDSIFEFAKYSETDSELRRHILEKIAK